MKITDIENNESYLNFESILKKCNNNPAKALPLYKSMKERSNSGRRLSRTKIKSPSTVSQFLYINGPVRVRWKSAMDQLNITRVNKIVYFFRFIFEKTTFFYDADFLVHELKFTGIFRISRPSKWKINMGLFLIPTKSSFALSKITNENINISTLGRIYVDKNRDSSNESSNEFFPNSCLPIKRKKDGQFENEDILFFSESELEKIIKKNYPKELNEFINLPPDLYLEEGNAINPEEPITKQELILLLILKGLHCFCRYPGHEIMKSDHAFNISIYKTHPSLKGKGISENSVDKRVKQSKKVSIANYSELKIRPKEFDSLIIINGTIIEKIINSLKSRIDNIGDLSKYLHDSDSSFQKIGIDQQSLSNKLSETLENLETIKKTHF